MPRRARPSTSHFRIAVFAVPLAGLLAACGASSDGVATLGSADGANSPSATASVDSRDARYAFAKCMRDNGVDMPDPSPEGGFRPPPGLNFGDPRFQAAMETCRSSMGAGSLANRAFDAAGQERMIKLAGCLREQGVDIPDPQFDSNGSMVIDPSIMRSLSDSKGQTALKQCQQFAPEEGGLGAPKGSD